MQRTFVGDQPKLKKVPPIKCCYWPSCRMFPGLERVIVGPFVRFTNGEHAHLICQEYAQEKQARENMGADLLKEHKSVFKGHLL